MTDQQKRSMNRRRLLGGAVAGGTALAVSGTLMSLPASANGRTTAAKTTPIPVPTLYTRQQWGAAPPDNAADVKVEPFAPALIVIHHMAYPNSTDYSREHAFQLSRDCQNDHMRNNGWNDMGQQLTISRGGYLMEGRYPTAEAIGQGKQVIGAHVANWNTASIGIENEGTYMTEVPPQSQWDTLVATCAWLCQAYGLPPMTALVGHRDLNQPGTSRATLCPGNAFYKKLPQLRAEVATAMNLPVGKGSPNHVEENLRQNLQTRSLTESRDHGPAIGPMDTSR